MRFGIVLSIFAATALACGGEMTEEEALQLEEEMRLADEAIGTTTQALGNSCNNTDISITNSYEDGTRATRILVRSVEYYSASEGNWYTEDLTNLEIPYGWVATWWNEDLAHAENDLLTAWRVHFSYEESDGDWSDPVTQYINTPDDICRADDNYSMTVD